MFNSSGSDDGITCAMLAADGVESLDDFLGKRHIDRVQHRLQLLQSTRANDGSGNRGLRQGPRYCQSRQRDAQLQSDLLSFSHRFEYILVPVHAVGELVQSEPRVRL